jgi:cytochrome P450
MPLIESTQCREPEAFYRGLRDRWGPVVPVRLEPGAAGRADINAWLVIGYQQVLELVRQEGRFSRDPRYWRDLASGRVPADSPLGPMMFPRRSGYFADGPEHQRLIAPVLEGLQRVNPIRMRSTVQNLCTALIADFAARGSADLVADYARSIPLLAVSALFGLDPHDGRALQRAMIALVGAQEDAPAASLDLNGIIAKVVNARRAAPTGDLTSLFIDQLRDEEEISQSMVMVIVAGWETTTTWIAQALRRLLTDNRFAGLLRGGRLDIDQALDQVLLLDPPMANMPARYATGDTWLGGQSIAAGDALILGLAGANHDPILRTGDPHLDAGNRAHLAFSTGTHGCPARDLARLIASTAIDTALRLLPGIRLAIAPDQIPLQPSPWARGPAALPVTFTAVHQP